MEFKSASKLIKATIFKFSGSAAITISTLTISDSELYDTNGLG
jgi:hypothetical protein